VVLEQIINSLTRPFAGDSSKKGGQTKEESSRIVFKGDLEEVNQFFFRRGWTDGLPIMPPTEESIEKLLKCVGLPGDKEVVR
jgi:hypothetical protein